MAISLVENRSCTRIQFHEAAVNLLCRTQRTTGELRFVTRESWSNFAEKISEELIIRLSALKHAFPAFLVIRIAIDAAIYFSNAMSTKIILPRDLMCHANIILNIFCDYSFFQLYFFQLVILIFVERVNASLKNDI